MNMAPRPLPLSLLALVVWLFVVIQVSARSIPTVGDGLLNVTSLPPTLQKRADKPSLTWDKAVQNGEAHICNFRRLTTPLDPKTKQKKTIWTQEDLNQYWLSDVYNIGDAGISESTKAISNALDGLGLPTAFPPNRGFNYVQDQPWYENGVEIEVRKIPHTRFVLKLTGGWHH